MNDIVWIFSAIIGLLVWLAQKRVEMETKVFEEAVTALLRYHAEANDQELQNDHYKLTNLVRRAAPYISNETTALMVRSTALVDSFFSKEVGLRFSKAMNSVHFGEFSADMDQ